MRIAAVGDLHCTATSQGAFQPLFAAMSAAADVVVLCGDLTDLGQPEEAHVLVKEMGTTRQVPVVAVLGNHDYESGAVDQVKQVLVDAGVQVLDGVGCSIKNVGFAGTKGLGGGFGERALQPWGEDIMKRLVRETVDEALKLESALARLRTPQRIAVLHYSPVRETVEGESPEVFPFLGSSRLEEPLLRYPVAAVFHGHAHRGRLEGRTRDGAPVYNVCLPLLRALRPEEPPFRIFELPGTAGTNESGVALADALTPAPVK
ncbi:MAG TPA: metallophosphoesterase [Methylomirabilota bacterium]|jgi:Icc-related predicted phosphoesterase|nr:metallophosphoesterase [Methylomirabilota bacterium]